MYVNTEPLASRMRPQILDHFVGQSHLLGINKPLRLAIEKKLFYSMILWGPPGTGKTTLAKIIANSLSAKFENISAVLSGVKDIRDVIARAEIAKQEGIKTIFFVDEVHRFNKAQQDAFLPHVEKGVVTFIGATTENPSFEINNALLSRARVYVLKPLDIADLLIIIHRAITELNKNLEKTTIEFALPLQEMLAEASDGDARRVLNLLEMAVDFAEEKDQRRIITENTLLAVLKEGFRRFDKKGEYFYDQISALHKSVRGSSPDAALYWLARMIDGGCDPLYIARRVIRMATEDIGNADPRALTLALNACEVYERLGSPEGELAIAQAVIYMACAPKSNATYVAWGEAMQDAKKQGSLEVPLHLRNAPTKLMKQLDYGKDYHYAHDAENAYIPNENYFPEKLGKPNYYRPVNRGLEIKIAEKLAQLKKWDQH